MCGLIGWAGKSCSKFNKAKFDVVAMMNDHRGGDSCGISIDSEIFASHEIGKRKFIDFLSKTNYEKPTKIPTVIAHTRKSSSGTISEYNTHPFGFGLNKKLDGYEFIGAHNGTLIEHDNLAKEFGVEVNLYSKNNVFVRRKIDSEVLLESIYLSKGFKPLSFYNGCAALIFTNTNEPNVIYAFHGASRETEGELDKDGKIKYIEERPLYYYKESKNSLYISSTFESLVAIGGVLEETVFEFKHNILYRIKDGDIDNAEKMSISRAQNFQKKSYNYNYNRGVHNNVNIGFNTKKENAGKENEIEKNNETNRSLEKETLISCSNTIMEEVASKPNNKSGVIFHKLRYKKNGHNLDGAFINILGYGLRRIGDDFEEAYEFMKQHLNVKFCLKNHVFNLNKDAFDENLYSIPIKSLDKHLIIYFHKGWRCKSYMDYSAFKSMNFTVKSSSSAVCHPICSEVLSSKNDEAIYYDGELADEDFYPLFSDVKYSFRKGKFVGYKIKNKSFVTEIIKNEAFTKSNTINLPDIKRNVINLNTGGFIPTEDSNFELTEYFDARNIDNESIQTELDFFQCAPINSETSYKEYEEELALMGEKIKVLESCLDYTLENLKKAKFKSQSIKDIIESCEDFKLTLEDIINYEN